MSASEQITHIFLRALRLKTYQIKREQNKQAIAKLMEKKNEKN